MLLGLSIFIVLSFLFEMLEEISMHFFESVGSKKKKIISFFKKFHLILFLRRIILSHFSIKID